MAMRFRKSINLGGGARFNLSKSGVGMSVGGKGLRYSVHSSGRKTKTIGIPGSGMYYMSSKSGSSRLSSGGGMTEAQQARLVERFDKKVQLIGERRNKPAQRLKEQYAAGKIDQSRYDDLAARDVEITEDLVVFGRGAGVKLGERYILGKIEKEEFENLKKELLGEVIAERDQFASEHTASVKYIDDFIAYSRSNASDATCNFCGKEKKFYRPLLTVLNFKLCLSCKMNYSNMLKVPSKNGRYYTVESYRINPDGQNNLHMNIRPEHILEYR